MKYRTDPENPIAGISEDFDENPVKEEESRNDHDDFYGDGCDDEDDFRGK